MKYTDKAQESRLIRLFHPSAVLDINQCWSESEFTEFENFQNGYRFYSANSKILQILIQTTDIKITEAGVLSVVSWSELE